MTKELASPTKQLTHWIAPPISSTALLESTVKMDGTTY